MAEEELEETEELCRAVRGQPRDPCSEVFSRRSGVREGGQDQQGYNLC